jgi:MFS family permease
MGAGALLVPLAPESEPLPFLIASQAIIGFGLPVYNVNQVSLRQAITPERLQGRMNSVMRFIVWGVIPLGSLAGGAIASGAGLRAAVWIGAVGVSLAFLPVLLSPVRSLREVPEPADDGAREGDALVHPALASPARGDERV